MVDGISELNIGNPGSFNDFSDREGLVDDRQLALERYSAALGRFRGSITGGRQSTLDISTLAISSETTPVDVTPGT